MTKRNRVKSVIRKFSISSLIWTFCKLSHQMAKRNRMGEAGNPDFLQFVSLIHFFANCHTLWRSFSIQMIPDLRAFQAACVYKVIRPSLEYWSASPISDRRFWRDRGIMKRISCAAHCTVEFSFVRYLFN